MSKCDLCEQGDPSVNIQCYVCHETFHVHKRQLDMVPQGTVFMGDCPYCMTINCWTKRDDGVVSPGPVPDLGQPVIDLRGKR